MVTVWVQSYLTLIRKNVWEKIEVQLTAPVRLHIHNGARAT